MAEDVKLKLIIDTANSAKTVADVRKSLKDLRTAALQVEQGSEAFFELTKAAGELQDRLNPINEQLKFFADGERNFTGFASTVNTLANSFSLAQSATALLGTESEDLQKVILKVQSAMAIANATQALANELKSTGTTRLFLQTAAQNAWNSSLVTSIRNLRGVQAAIAATGFGAIAVAVGLIVVNWDKLNNAFRETGVVGKVLISVLLPIIPAFQAITAVLEKFNIINTEVGKSTADLTSELELQVKVLEAQGASFEKIFKVKREILKLQATEIQMNIAMEKDEEKRLELQRELNKVLGDYLGLLKQKKEEQKKDAEEEKKILDDLEKKRKEAWDKESKRLEEERLRRAELLSESLALRAEAIRQMQEFMKKVAEEDNSFEQLQQKERDAARQAEILSLFGFEQKRQQALFDFQKATRDLTIADQEQLKLERLKYQQALTQIDQEQAAQREQIRQAELQAAIDLTNGLTDVLNAFGKDSAEYAAFSKTLALVQIGIETTKALADLTTRATAAGTQAGVAAGAATAGIGAAPAAAAMSAATYISGAAQILSAIAKAKAVLQSTPDVTPPQFATGGFVSGAGTATSDSIPAWLSNGEFVVNAKSTSVFAPLLDAMNNMTLDSSFMQARNGGNGASQNNVSPIESKQSIEVKAYVSEKEITDSQKRITKIERNGTIY